MSSHDRFSTSQSQVWREDSNSKRPTLTYFKPLPPADGESLPSTLGLGAGRGIRGFLGRMFARGPNDSDDGVEVEQGPSVEGGEVDDSCASSSRGEATRTTASALPSSPPHSPAPLVRQIPRTRTLPSLVRQRLSQTLLGSNKQTPEIGVPPLRDYQNSDFRQYWMPDSSGRECYGCGEKFTAFRRRHHCRVCGQIFCSRCCNLEVSGRILGYLGELRLCSHCCTSVLQFLDGNAAAGSSMASNSASLDGQGQLSDGSAAAGPAQPQQLNDLATVSAGVSLFNSNQTTSISGERAEHSATPKKSHAYSSHAKGSGRPAEERSPAVLSVLDLENCSKVDVLNDVDSNASVGSGISGRVVDEWEPEWVRNIEVAERRLSSSDCPPNKNMEFRGSAECQYNGGSDKGGRLTPGRRFPTLPTLGLVTIACSNGSYCEMSAEGSEQWSGFASSTTKPIERMFESQTLRLLRYIMRREGVDETRWAPVVWPLCREIAHTLQPNTIERRDSPDVLQYLHVKKLPCLCADEVASAAVVFGTVLSKAVADKRMAHRLSQPSIMIVSGGIEYERTGTGAKFTSIEPVLLQEAEFLRNMVSRISSYGPELLFVEKTVARLAQEYLRLAGVTLVYGLRAEALQRLSRCTQADIVPSVESLLARPKLGNCGSFRVEAVELVDGRKKSLMFLEDCEPNLSCTVVISGRGGHELRAAKRVLRFMVSVLYSSKLEAELFDACQVCLPSSTEVSAEVDCKICLLNARYPLCETEENTRTEEASSLSFSAGDAVLSSSPFLIYSLPYVETDKGRKCKLLNYFKQPLYQFRTEPVEQPPAALEACEKNRFTAWTDGQRHGFLCDKLVASADSEDVRAKVAMFRLKRTLLSEAPPSVNILDEEGKYPEGNNWTLRRGSKSKRRVPSTGGRVDALSPYQHQRIAVLFGSYSPKSANAPLFCVRPWVVWMEFYGLHDMPLGEFLKRYCFNADYRCPSTNCDVSMLEHWRKIVHRNGCIEITTQDVGAADWLTRNSNENFDQDNSIFMWEWCSRCKSMTPCQEMSSTLWQLSFARYLDYVLNGRHMPSLMLAKDATNTERVCSHCAFHEHEHYFASQGHLTTFKVTSIHLYDLAFSSMVCTIEPILTQPSHLLAKGKVLAQKADSVFQTMAEQVSEMSLTANAEPQVGLLNNLNTFLSETQEVFAKRMDYVNETVDTLLPGDNKQISKFDAIFLKASDGLVHCRQILANGLLQWNQTVAEYQLQNSKNKKISLQSSASSAALFIATATAGTAAPKYNDSVPDLAPENGSTTKGPCVPTDAAAVVAKGPNTVEVPSQIVNPLDVSHHYSLPSGKIPIIIRDGELSSIIAYALSSSEYERKRRDLRENCGLEGVALTLKMSFGQLPAELSPLIAAEHAVPADKDRDVQQEVQTDQHHIELQFSDCLARYYTKVYYAEHFRMLRKLLFADGEEAFQRSLSRSDKWKPQGGKSGANFYRTRDGRFILKQMSRFEVQSFLKFAPNYFHYVSTAATENKLTALAKIYGVFRMGFRNLQTNSAWKMDVFVMEYLFYKRNICQVYDLKGSLRNRMASERAAENDLVLLDENLLKHLWSHQLYLHPHAKAALNMAISNDSHFLSAHSIMDYSLLVGVDEERRELVLGIVDYMRTYTLDKKLESWVKIVAVPGAHLPTILSPEMYCTRFSEAIETYFPVAPDQWTGLGHGIPY